MLEQQMNYQIANFLLYKSCDQNLLLEEPTEKEKKICIGSLFFIFLYACISKYFNKFFLYFPLPVFIITHMYNFVYNIILSPYILLEVLVHVDP